MNLSHLSQMAVCDPYSKDDLLAIVTTSDDMEYYFIYIKY